MKMPFPLKYNKEFTSKEISELLEISSPFLFLDRLVVTPAKELSDWRAEGFKQLNPEDWFFACHLPSIQTMPATLVSEGMLQTLVSLIYCCIDHGVNRSLVTHLKVHINRGAKAGQLLIFKSQLISSRHGILKGKVIALINQEEMGQGEFQYASPHLMVFPKLEK